MILTDYYRFERTKFKSKTRLDCVSSTKTYPQFEEKRAETNTKETSKIDATNIGDLVIYYGNVPERFSANAKRKAGKSISLKGKSISSVYVPDPESEFAYGDFKGTKDAILFCLKDVSIVDGWVQKGCTLEIFIARGRSRDCLPLYNLLCDGGLNEEMQNLRQKADAEKVQ